MITIAGENFDATTVGTIPAAWSQTSGNIFSVQATGSSPTPQSGANVLKLGFKSGATVQLAWYNGSTDNNSGNGQAQFYVNVGTLNATETLYVVGRLTSPASNPTYYRLKIQITVTPTLIVQFQKVVAGTSTSLGSAVTSAATAAGWHSLLINLNGTALVGTIQQPSGNYLNGSGSWVSSAANVQSITDSAVSGAGYWGVASLVNGNSSDVLYVDTFLSQALNSPGTSNYTRRSLSEFGTRTGSRTACFRRPGPPDGRPALILPDRRPITPRAA